MNKLEKAYRMTDGVKGMSGIHDAIQKLRNAKTALDTTAAASQLVAELAITTAVTATVQTSMSMVRLGLAISWQTWKWEDVSWAAGVASGRVAGEIIDSVNGLNLDSHLYDLLHQNQIDATKSKLGQASTLPSPIILDLDNDGIETTSQIAGAYFDHAADGFAEKTGWAGKDDGLLVRDLDNNGRIDSGRELFGSETLLANKTKAANGFEALKQHDSNKDGKIDATDATFATLKIWQDDDGDGFSQAEELHTLAGKNIQFINVGYTQSTTTDANGNQHWQVGRYTTTADATRAATDVWFQADPIRALSRRKSPDSARNHPMKCWRSRGRVASGLRLLYRAFRREPGIRRITPAKNRRFIRPTRAVFGLRLLARTGSRKHGALPSHLIQIRPTPVFNYKRGLK